MSTSSLLRKIAVLRPQAGNLIQTILELGEYVGSVPLGIVDESGVPTLSLRTIVNAMEVIDDYSKTKDFTGTPSSKVLHAYGLVERAVSGEHLVRGQLSTLRLAGPPEFDGPSSDVGGGRDGDPSATRGFA